MWRGHQIEQSNGKVPRWYGVGLYGYLAAMGLTLYFVMLQPLTTGLELFGAALVSEGLGIIVTATLVEAFISSRGRPWKERAFPMIGALFLAAVVGATVLTS